ncbi:MAG TPA: thioredoxin family protein [Spirochaetia bacterium]|nr:thioredoxin family protein [Spirochaetia bacterium]
MNTTTLPLTPEVFNTGSTWENYLSQMKDYGATSARLYDEATIPSDIIDGFAELVSRHGGRLSVSAMTEDWCGDSAVTLPYIARLAASVPGMELRVLIGMQHPELKAAYEGDGMESIPLLSLFDKDWKEIGRWMERPKPANPLVEAWVAARPRIGELMGKDDPEAQRELKSIFAKLIPEMADWYRGGLWRDILIELREAAA